MAYARHKAPPRTPRLHLRCTDAVALTGVAVLALAVIGVNSSPSDDPPRHAQVQAAEAELTTMVGPITDELAELREERDDARLRAARGADRPATDVAPPPITATPVAPLPATTTAYTTVAVNVRAASSSDSAVLAVLELGAEIAVTGRAAGEYAEIVHDGGLAWVYAAYAAATPPVSDDVTEAETGGVDGGVSSAPCASGSDVESGLVSNAVAVHRAVCALFPGVSSYGGLRPGDGGEHGSGQALDIMVSTALGDEIAAYLQAHYGELGIRELIWRQRIWSTDRASDGWRPMEDRGSATANHYDHVHVTVS